MTDRAAYERRLRAVARQLRQGETPSGDDAPLIAAALRHYERHQAADRKRSRPGHGGKRERRPRAIPPFVSIDGEGLDRQDGQHDYTFLAASDGRYIERWARDGLPTRDCLNFIIETAQLHPKAQLVGFGFGYDSNMVARDIADAQVERYADGESVTWRGGNGWTYRLRYLNRHMLYVARGQWTRDGFKAKRGDTTTVWDSFGFFQTSFIKALEAWNIGTPAQRARVSGMKERRGMFSRTPRALIRAYCIEECELLDELMGALGDVLAQAEIYPRRWDGAGAVAAELLRAGSIADHVERAPVGSGRESAELCAYFGGRVERFQAGRIDGAVYDYDLNSAYPAQIAQLPSLHGRWRRRRRHNAREPWALWHVTWSTKGDLAPFPFRQRRSVYWPHNGSGWYHAAEVLAALECIPGDYRIDDGWVFTPADPDARPFAWVTARYLERLAYKRVGDARNVVLKLGLNALYGKLAQGQTHHGRLPPFRSYFWAGAVTAGTRAAMLRAASLAHPDELVSIATDGLFVTRRLALPLSDELGAWGETRIEPGLCIIQAGMMITPSRAFLRTRGLSREGLSYGAVTDAWERHGFRAQLPIRERRFAGAALAVMLNDLNVWRRWHDIPRTVTFNPAPRKYARMGAYERWGAAEPVYPPFMADGAESEPYKPKAVSAWRTDADALDARIDDEDPDIDAHSVAV